MEGPSGMTPFSTCANTSHGLGRAPPKKNELPRFLQNRIESRCPPCRRNGDTLAKETNHERTTSNTTGLELPVLPAKVGLRPRHPSRWRTAVLIAVHVAIAAHLLHWQVTGSSLAPLEPSEAMELSKHGVINAGAVFFAVAILFTALFGRFFCGWGCHLVAVQDLCRWLLIKLGMRPRALRVRSLGLVPLIAFVYMFLWPPVYRVWAGIPYEGLSMKMSTSDMWATFPGWVWAVITFLVCGFAIVFVFGSKGFCTYACPYGAAFAIADRFAVLRIRVTEACRSCAKCTAACTSNIRVHEQVAAFGSVVDSGCMKCLDCVASCPNDALYLGVGPAALVTRPRDVAPRVRWSLTWPEELFLGSVFVASFLVFRGLYGVVPFLLSLGLAAIVGCTALVAMRCARSTDAWFGPLHLTVDGRRRPQGVAMIMVVAAMAVLLVHSAAVHWTASRGHEGFSASASFRDGLLDLDRPLQPVIGADAELVERSLFNLERSQSWGLIDDPTLDPELAWLHFFLGNWDRVEHHLNRALKRRPDRTDLHLLDARVAFDQGLVDKAVEAYSRVLELDPGSETAYLGLGTVFGRTGRPAEAAAVFERGVAARPDRPELAYNFGVAMAMQGNAEGAVAGFEAALTLDPDHLRALENLSGVLLGTGRASEAIPYLEKAIQVSPDDPMTRVMFAQALAGIGDLEGARQQVAVALELDPEQPAARQLAAALADAAGR